MFDVAFELLMEVASPIEQAVAERGEDDVSANELAIIGCIWANGVIGNGGFQYWYECAGKTSTWRVAAGMDRVGMRRLAELIRSSMSFFPDGAPPDDTHARHALVYDEASEERRTSFFEPLDDEFYKLADELDRRLVVFALSHREELVRLYPVLEDAFARYERALENAAHALRAAANATRESETRPVKQLLRDARLRDALHAVESHSGNARERASYWEGLLAAAESLGVHDHVERYRWRTREASRGSIRVHVEDTNQQLHANRKVRWNEGKVRRGFFGSHRAIIEVEDDSRPGESDRRIILLHPLRGAVRSKYDQGTTLVIHDRGEVIGRGHVAETIPPGS